MITFDPMDGCSQCKWAESAYGTSLVQKCELHQRIEDLQIDLGIERQVRQADDRIIQRLYEVLKIDPEDDLVEIATARMEELQAAEEELEARERRANPA